MLGVLTALLLAGPGAVHDIGAGGQLAYRPEGLRVAPGDTVRFPASAGHPLRFDGEDGPAAVDGTVERVLAAEGVVRFYCEAHGGPDGGGMSGVVVVGAANEPPTVALGAPPAVSVRRPLVLVATGRDPERIALRYAWDLDGNGSFERVAGPVVRVVPRRAGRLRVRVRAADDAGATAEAARTVRVRARR